MRRFLLGGIIAVGKVTPLGESGRKKRRRRRSRYK
jgi:hypothetical protein